MKLATRFRLAVAMVLSLAVIVPADAATLCTPFGCATTPDLFASRRQKEEKCYEEYLQDSARCGRLHPVDRATCYARAADKLGKCMKKAGGR